jgi:hypothetical protein
MPYASNGSKKNRRRRKRRIRRRDHAYTVQMEDEK